MPGNHLLEIKNKTPSLSPLSFLGPAPGSPRLQECPWDLRDEAAGLGTELRADGGGNNCVLKEKLIHSDDTNIELVLDCLTM